MASGDRGVIDPAAVALARAGRLSSAGEARAAQVIGALCDPTRLRILRALSRTPLASSDIALVIGRSRPATSQHLRILREMGVVVTDRRGNSVRYRLSESAGPLQRIVASLDEPGSPG